MEKTKAEELQKLSTTEVERVTQFLYEDYEFDEKGLLYRARKIENKKKRDTVLLTTL